MMQAGAAKVYAVEASDMATHAAQLALANPGRHAVEQGVWRVCWCRPGGRLRATMPGVHMPPALPAGRKREQQGAGGAGFGERVQVVKGRLEELTFNATVDVLISEPM